MALTVGEQVQDWEEMKKVRKRMLLFDLKDALLNGSLLVVALILSVLNCQGTNSYAGIVLNELLASHWVASFLILTSRLCDFKLAREKLKF